MTPAYAVVFLVPPGRVPPPGRDALSAQRRWARAALARSAALGGLTLGALEKGDAGEPLPRGGVCWSLAHAEHAVAAIAARRPVGIDVETIAPFSAALRERVASPAEWALAPAVDDLLACRYWTAKEAVLKATGAGIAGLGRCAVTQVADGVTMRLSFDGVPWTVIHARAGERSLAAVTGEQGEVTWDVRALEAE